MRTMRGRRRPSVREPEIATRHRRSASTQAEIERVWETICLTIPSLINVTRDVLVIKCDGELKRSMGSTLNQNSAQIHCLFVKSIKTINRYSLYTWNRCFGLNKLTLDPAIRDFFLYLVNNTLAKENIHVLN